MEEMMHYYFPGMVVGLILMQTAIVAPSLFRNLEIEVFGKVIRDLWPKFFLALGLIGTLSLVSVYLQEDSEFIHYGIAGLTVILSAICYLIIPATNKATDEGNESLFRILHRVSVTSTVVMLISNILYVFF
ncbi:MAG: hypothetical protein CMB47_06385 [Euryarchaeota archaeon]|nr:hypothetical protein [Euryarchaeota archaeon]